MTTTDTQAARVAFALAWLAEMPPLPTVDEMAGPFIRGLLGLFSVAERLEAMRPVADLWETEGRAAVDRVRQAAEIVAEQAAACVVVRGGVFEEVRRLVERIADIDDLRSELLTADLERLAALDNR